ncbi:PhnD/SsuA/transferrin family substrate-binding protein [Leptolyngbya sp. FACHB-16]|uniref:PhnD/SsuA/transferrin family substrate-binding protein n=1 Tax=unclassified Leptolyngbya TaxID=2650499 RepID=UPI0016826BB9|nr:PhnD/SsuA/transferrin family substrate-binding protein [Leptolyngbya sp. FACHB-16]MBD2156857.1 PhnD/SsuA/transferrin family substrate-binding protein [Leptolyngbya sp. FACHB-16]
MKRRHFLWYSALVFTGCTAATTTSKQSPSQPLPTKLRFAVTDVKGLEKLQAEYESLRVALAMALETEVEFFPVENYTTAAIGLKQGTVELALAGPSEYVVITSRTNAVPVVGITRPNYRSIIATSASSLIKTVVDLKGKTIAMSDIGSTSGHLGPTKLLIDAGIDPQTDIQVQMLGDEGSVEALKQGKVDAWGGSAVDYKDFLESTTNTFPVLIEGSPLPNDIFIASSSLDAAVIHVMRERMLVNQQQLVEAIAQHHTKYKGSQLTLAKDEDYDLVRDVYLAVGQGDFVQ